MNYKNEMVDWDDIYRETGFFDDKCWETCNSYCCTFTDVVKNFTYIRKVNSFPLFPGEYEYLERNNLLQEGFAKAHVKIKMPIRDHVFILDLVECRLKGICTDHKTRPILCRLHPAFPVVSLEGRITGFDNIIPVDQFWGKIKENGVYLRSPCIINKFSLESFNKLLRICYKVLKYPINNFYMQLAYLYKNGIYADIVNNHQQIFDQGADNFFKAYEGVLIANKFMDKVKEQAALLFDQFVTYYGRDWYQVR